MFLFLLQIEAAGQRPEAAGRLHFLDLADELLTPDGRHIRPHLQLDGTHMAPAFVAYLSAALAWLPELPGTLQ